MALSFPTRRCASELGSVMSDSRVRFTAISRRSASVAPARASSPAAPPSALMMVSSFLTLRYGQRVMPCSRHRCFKTVTHNPSCAKDVREARARGGAAVSFHCGLSRSRNRSPRTNGETSRREKRELT